MSEAAVESGNGEKVTRYGRRRNITITFSQDEIDFYDQLMAERGLTLSALSRTALKFTVWIWKKLKAGVKIKFVYPDGSEEFLSIFELDSLGVLKQ